MSLATASEKERFLDLLEQAPTSGQFAKLRQAALARFRELPLPTMRTEDWRFTNIAPLLRVPFEGPTGTTGGAVALPPLPTPDTLRLVFVNGAFQRTLSVLANIPAGVHVGPLAEAPSASVAEALGQVADYRTQVFTALNTASIQDGACVIVAGGTALLRPVEIISVTQAAERPLLTQPRTLIVAGKNSQVTVVERFLTTSDDTYLTNAVTEVLLAEGAQVDHYKVQQESRKAYHVANTQAVLAERGNFATHYLSLGGGLVRNEVRVRFDAEHAEATVNGLYLADGRQHVDNLTEIDHAHAHCASHEVYKGILAEHAHGVFNGKIIVRPDAQKTDAKQTNKVLLLSDDATINTKPQLEIYADDVKCTHGATVGQLDADEIFYLQARGLDLAAARSLLTFAFANDIVSRVKVEALREEIEQLLLER
jgi:Fe-S cluster assembly protein SufD